MTSRIVVAAVLVSVGSLRPAAAAPAVGLAVGFAEPVAGDAWEQSARTTATIAGQLSVPMTSDSSADTIVQVGHAGTSGGDDGDSRDPVRLRLLEAVTLGTPFTETTTIALRLGLGLDVVEYRSFASTDWSPLLYGAVVLTKHLARVDLVASLGLSLASHDVRYSDQDATAVDLEGVFGVLVKL